MAPYACSRRDTVDLRQYVAYPYSKRNRLPSAMQPNNVQPHMLRSTTIATIIAATIAATIVPTIANTVATTTVVTSSSSSLAQSVQLECRHVHP
jgi:hypothetical protein